MIVVTVARRPLSGSVADTALSHGTGALNIDQSRIATVAGEVVGPGSWSDPSRRVGEVGGDLGFTGNDVGRFQQAQAESVERANRLGRWPANLVLSDRGARALDAQSGVLRARGNTTPKDHGSDYEASSYQFGGRESGDSGDAGGASRFFKRVQG